MLINRANLSTLYDGFNAAFTKGLDGAPTAYKDVSMVVPSSAASETYGWMGQFPKLREWIGDRIVKNLSAHAYTIVNRKFESTVSVARTDIEDDRFGVFAPILAEMGKTTAEHPDELIFSLLAQGFITPCFDGQYFFDTDHPVDDGSGFVQSVSNSGGGSGTPWFLLDTSRAIKPMVYQERAPGRLQQLTDDGDENVFWRDEYVYGVRGRSNAGFGLWQLAYGSRQPLDAASYAAARAAMMSFKGDGGRPLGIKPNLLVVPPQLEGQALQILNAELTGAGASNVWKGTANVLTTPWIS